MAVGSGIVVGALSPAVAASPCKVQNYIDEQSCELEIHSYFEGKIYYIIEMHTSSFAQPPPAPGLAFAIPIAAVDILRCFTSDVTGVIKFDELGDVTMVLLLAWPVCIAPPAPCSAATMLPLPTLCGDDKSPPLGFLNFENNFRTKWS